MTSLSGPKYLFRRLVIYSLLASLMTSLPAAAQMLAVAPDVGQWDIGEARCEWTFWGYGSDVEAEDAGIVRAYDYGCGYSFISRDTWPDGTPGNSSRLICGGMANGLPIMTLGIESENVKRPTVEYGVGFPSCLSTANDSFNIFRKRLVQCPQGTSWNGLFCVRGAFDPFKNESCAAGGNPTNPIHSALGHKMQTEVDFVASSGPLSFERYYSSSTHLELAELGKNWRHNYNRRLSIVPTEHVTTATAYRPNGSRVYFNASGGGVWLKDPDVTMSLVEDYDGGVIQVGWLLTDASDTAERYSLDGQLTSITDRNGRTQTLSYEGGLLKFVSDDTGRRLSFEYDAPYSGAALQKRRKLQRIWLPDGTALEYFYNAGGYLQQVRRPDSTPGSTADNPVRSYSYGEGANNAAWLLTGITDENTERFASWSYDAQNRGILSVHGQVGDYADRVEVTYGAGGTTFRKFLDDPSAPGGVRYFDSQYGFVLSQGVYRFASATQPCPSCGGTGTQTKTYDPNGFNDTSTDFNGNVTDQDHDTRGLETIRIEAQGKDTQLASPFSDERRTETDWHASFRVPTERRSYRCSAPSTTSAQPCSGVGGSNLWQLESLSRYSHNTRGQTNARCEIDPTDATAMAYTCGASSNAPARVRQTLTTYCEAGDVAPPGSTCPLLGLVKTMDGARIDVSDLSTYTYYAADHASCASAPTTCAYRKGDLWKVSNALNQVSEYVSYDGAGRVKRMKDANGTITDLTYHARGWLATRTVRANTNGTPNASLDAVTTLTYDNVGQVTRVTQADGAYIDYTYDAAHRLTGISDNLGNTLSYTLDAAGNRTAENTRDPSNALTRTLGRVYDSLGRLHKLLNAQNAETVFAYDANGNQDTVTDALLRVTDSDVDPLNRLIKSTDALMGNTQYRYDARDNLTKVIDAKGLATDYVYDGLSDLMRLVSPDTGTTQYTYDSAGNRATQTDARGVVSSYSYDVLNRLIGIGYPTSSNNVAFSYDQNHGECDADEQFGVGRLTGFTDPSGSTKLCYDLRGNVKRKIAVVNGNTLVTRWSFSTADRIMQMTYPSELQVDYGRDDLGRIVGIHVSPGGTSGETLINNVTYYPFGPVRTIEWGNGSTSTRSYDQNYWIDNIDSSQADGLDLEFSLDVVGNITGLSDVQGGTPPSNTYAYDELYRLSDVGVASGSLESYTYDPIGNRLSKTVDPGFGPVQIHSYTYGAASHRLLQVSGAARAYDDNGNTIKRNSGASSAPQFFYDERNRFASVSTPSAQTVFEYNARGERVLKNVDNLAGATRSYTYDQSGRLLLEANQSGKPLQEYIWLDDLPVGVFMGESLHYIQPDHLGSPRKVIDVRTDSAIWDWPILDNPFGEAAPNEDPDGDSAPFVMNLRFPGQYFDAETGLHYNYFRDYEPGTGRYVESDPIGLRGGVGTYGYVEGSPLDTLDRLGLRPGHLECKTRRVYDGMYRKEFDERYECKFVPDPPAPPEPCHNRSECEAGCAATYRKCRILCNLLPHAVAGSLSCFPGPRKTHFVLGEVIGSFVQPDCEAGCDGGASFCKRGCNDGSRCSW